MPNYSNPAWRIYETMNEVMSYGNEHYSQVQPNYSPPMRVVWMEAMQLEPEEDADERTYRDKLTEVMEQVILLEESIRRNLSMNQKVYLSQCDRVKRAIFQIEAKTYDEYSRLFNEDLLLMLQTSADALSHYSYEPIIPLDDLQRLQAEVDELLESVLSSDIPAELKKLLTEGLASIRDAILRYRVYGAEGIRKAVDRNLGLIFRHPEDFTSASNEESEDVLSKYKGFVLRANQFVTLTVSMYSLAERGFEALQNVLGAGD